MQGRSARPSPWRSRSFAPHARPSACPPQNEAHPQPEPLLTAPNVLTFLRVVLVPVFVGLWFSPAHYAPAGAALVFMAASITDWLDGFLARLVRRCPTEGPPSALKGLFRALWGLGCGHSR